MNEQNPTCTSCHRVIVAEEGDTCASIPVWQRGRFDYCDTAATAEQPAWLTDLVNATPPWPSQPCAECRRVLPLGTAHYTPKRRALCAQCYQAATVPERAPDGMLAVRVGSDPWTMVPLDNEQDTSAEGASDMQTCHHEPRVHQSVYRFTGTPEGHPLPHTANGGYPLVYSDTEGNQLCAHCASQAEDYSACTNDVGVHYEGGAIACENCGTVIESAYGDPDDN